MGLNRFVIHTSVHQPLLDKGPGLSLGPFGQWFTRNETWAEPARAWVTYLARSSFLLQQGRFVADVAYYYGEDTNVTALFRDKAPPVPAGYNFDYVNADALVHLLSVVDGQLAAPSGMRYRVLALDPNSRHMSLPVLAQDSRPRLGRRGRGRTEAAVHAQPERRRGRVPPAGRRALGERDGERRSQDRQGHRLRRRQPG